MLKSTIILVIVFIVAAAFFARYFTNRSVKEAISEYVSFVKKVATGNLTVQMDTKHMEKEMQVSL